MKMLMISTVFIAVTAVSAKQKPTQYPQDFNLNSTKEVYAIEAQKGDNFVYSPYSLKMALGILAQGAGKDSMTEAVLSDSLGHPGFNQVQLGKHLKRLQGEINASSGSSVTIESANSVLVNPIYNIGELFLNRVQNLLDALVKNFSPTIIEEANQWVSQKTRGKIKDIVEPSDVGPRKVAVLLNAIYFKGDWQIQFNPKHSLVNVFRNEDGTSGDVQMMNMYRTKLAMNQMYTGTKVLKLPFKKSEDGKTLVSMYFVLPSADSDLNQVFEHEITDQRFWNSIDARPMVEQTLGRVAIPKFKIEKTLNLKEMIYNLPNTDEGPLSHIFNNPDLSEIAKRPLKVSAIAQKAFIEVNEQGAEAAAVTKIVVATRAGTPSRSTNFIANRPFAYVLRHESTGEILFVGTHVRGAE